MNIKSFLFSSFHMLMFRCVQCRHMSNGVSKRVKETTVLYVVFN